VLLLAPLGSFQIFGQLNLTLVVRIYPACLSLYCASPKVLAMLNSFSPIAALKSTEPASRFLNALHTVSLCPVLWTCLILLVHPLMMLSIPLVISDAWDPILTASVTLRVGPRRISRADIWSSDTALFVRDMAWFVPLLASFHRYVSRNTLFRGLSTNSTFLRPASIGASARGLREGSASALPTRQESKRVLKCIVSCRRVVLASGTECKQLEI
jgi:hypothetical protein